MWQKKIAMIKKFLLNPWTVGIGSTVCAAIILKIFDLLVGTKILDYIGGALYTSLKFLYNLLDYRLPIGLFLSILLIYFLYKRINLRKNRRPIYLDYKEDEFQGILYRWSYKYLNGKYRIEEIVAYCPTCKHRIVHDQCLNCGAVYLDKKNRQERKAMIYYGVEKKYNINEFHEFGE